MMDCVSHDRHDPLMSLLAEARTFLRMQMTVMRALDLLQQLIVVQLQAPDGAGWDEGMQRKQLLLDELEQVRLGAMAGQVRQLSEKLEACGQEDYAEQMRANLRMIRERLLALEENEALTQHALAARIDEIRYALCEQQHGLIARQSAAAGSGYRRRGC